MHTPTFRGHFGFGTAIALLGADVVGNLVRHDYNQGALGKGFSASKVQAPVSPP